MAIPFRVNTTLQRILYYRLVISDLYEPIDDYPPSFRCVESEQEVTEVYIQKDTNGGSICIHLTYDTTICVELMHNDIPLKVEWDKEWQLRTYNTHDYSGSIKFLNDIWHIINIVCVN